MIFVKSGFGRVESSRLERAEFGGVCHDVLDKTRLAVVFKVPFQSDSSADNRRCLECTNYHLPDPDEFEPPYLSLMY